MEPLREESRSTESRISVAELVEANLKLVGRLVRERLAKVPAHVNADELTSAAMMALFLSAQSYDPDLGVPFRYFAAIRIRGALLDELRGMDWATRSVRCQAREVESAHGRLALILDHAPRSDELADAMQVSPQKLHSLRADISRATVLRLHGVSPGTAAEQRPEASEGPESLILLRERLGYLHDAIAELSERHRFVVNAYYFERRHMIEIAAELGLTQARVSQLCAESLAMLRDGINSQLDPSATDRLGQTGRKAATRRAYFGAIARRNTLSGRLAMSTAQGDMRVRAQVPKAMIA